MKTPFLDLEAHHAPMREEILDEIRKVVEKNAFAGGPFVEAFEADFAEYCHTRHAVAVGSGTEALWLALLARGIGPGDEVITVPNTFIATAEAISFTGATPVFVDIWDDTMAMNPAGIADVITPRTKAIVPVQLYGQTADMDSICAIAREHGLFVLEDACQAHGAEYHGRRAGSLGDAGCFSFYPGKNLGAWGEGGALVTDDEALANGVKELRDHGQPRKYMHSRVGWNSRMDGIQAAVLRIKLKYLEKSTEARRRHAASYGLQLDGVENLKLPVESEGYRHVYHLYPIRVPQRAAIMEQLAADGIGCAIHYPVCIHLQEAYRHLGLAEGSFPVAERSAEELISLPMYGELNREQVDFVSSRVTHHLAKLEGTPGTLLPC